MHNGNDFWPAAEAFLDLAAVQQLSDGRARCTAVAVCDDAGQPTRAFVQCQAAHFYYEFEILRAIGRPSGGLEFHDALGRVVHGKNSFQFASHAPDAALPGQRLRYHHVIHLDVAAADYRFTVGLASADPQRYLSYCDGLLTHEEFSLHTGEHCRAVDAGTFTVSVDPTGKLRHHGLVDLPGGSRVALIEPPPTIIHVTHWKAGSQWILKILADCSPHLLVGPEVSETQFLFRPLQSGKVYPTVYVTKRQYDNVSLPANTRRFVIIRDLRDTLVSAYFGLKSVHPVIDDSVAKWRAVLQAITREEGLIYLMDEWLPACADIQASWLEAGEPLIRYEDLLTHDLEIFDRVLIDECGLTVPRERLRQAVLANRFERITNGRPRGRTDENAHERKGIAGDWHNHFTPRAKKAFKERFGELLIATGYARDLSW